MSETEALQKRFAAALMPNYGVPPVAITRGEGCRVWDADGREYLDLIAGIAVSSLGHAHPAIVAAVTRQVAEVAHTSNLFLHERELELAERILCLLGGSDPPQTPPAPGGKPFPPDPLGTPSAPPLGGTTRSSGPADGRVFFANSGTEANEAAIKLVRRIQGSARPVIVAAEHGFHGRTMGSLALTGKESIRAPFAPFGLTVRFVPFGDAAALQAAVGPDCAAVFLERPWARAAWCPRPRVTCARRAKPATPPARCWWSTRSRAASGGPGPGSPTRPRACARTC